MYIPFAKRTSNGRFGYLVLLMDIIVPGDRWLGVREFYGWGVGAANFAEGDPGVSSKHRPATGLIHHRHRGGQDAGQRYPSMLRRSVMRRSMCNAGNCHDNVFKVSCFGTANTESEFVDYANDFEARSERSTYIRNDNIERQHSGLGQTALPSKLTAEEAAGDRREHGGQTIASSLNLMGSGACVEHTVQSLAADGTHGEPSLSETPRQRPPPILRPLAKPRLATARSNTAYSSQFAFFFITSGWLKTSISGGQQHGRRGTDRNPMIS